MIYWWKDSFFSDDLRKRLNDRAADETVASFFLYLNICTSCGVIAAWFGLSLNAVIDYLLLSYIGLLLPLVVYVILLRRTSSRNNLPHFSLVGDLNLLTLTIFNEFANSQLQSTNLSLIVVGGIFATVTLARSAFVQFVVTKTLIFTLIIFLILTSSSSTSGSLLPIFLVIGAYLVIMMNAYWLYLSQIRQIHQTLNTESLSQQLKIEQDLSERLFVFIGHDLRQPLNAIEMLLFSLKSESSTITQAREGVSSAKRLIDNILQIATYRNGEITVDRKSIAVSKLFEEVNNEYFHLAKAKNSELRIVNSSLSVFADKALLGRAVKNLVSNAISYAPNAKILLGIRRRKNGIAIWIVDQGEGLHTKTQQRLSTNKPMQTENLSSKGFGLGLSIANEFIKANGAQMNIRATPKKGSTIEIFFPNCLA